MENQIYGTGMVFHIEPVPNVLSFSVYRERLAVTYIVYKERNKLLGKLIRTIIVGTIRDNRRHAISIMERSHEMV